MTGLERLRLKSAYPIPCCTTASVTVPKKIPGTVPNPPVSKTPTTTAMIVLKISAKLVVVVAEFDRIVSQTPVKSSAQRSMDKQTDLEFADRDARIARAFLVAAESEYPVPPWRVVENKEQQGGNANPPEDR